MNKLTFRHLNESEKALIERLLQAEFQGREAIAEQVNHCLVREIDENGSLEFDVKSGTKANVKKRIPIEGQVADIDGVLIHVLLHVVNQRIKELEIYKDDSSSVLRMPPLGRLELMQLP